MRAMWVYAADDDIANSANVHEMMAVFTQMPSQVRLLSAHEHGVDEIGHMKFFSRKNRSLWPQIGQWIRTQPS